MEIEIKKTENGLHVVDKVTNEEWCFEKESSLFDFLKERFPVNIGDEIKIID